MAAKKENIVTKRAFEFNAIRLDDMPGKTPDEIRKAYAELYPELLNATVKGPVTNNGESVYTFAAKVGAKG